MGFHFRRTCRTSVEHGKSKCKKLLDCRHLDRSCQAIVIVSDCLIVSVICDI